MMIWYSAILGEKNSTKRLNIMLDLPKFYEEIEHYGKNFLCHSH